MLMMPVMSNPDATISVVLSMVPFWAPVLFFIRMSVQVPPAWQVLGVNREHREDDEHAEHAQAKNAREPGARAQFGRAHSVAGGHGEIRLGEKRQSLVY